MLSFSAYLDPSMASGWAHLPDDLLDMVAQRTTGIKDYVRLRAVCKSWRFFLRPKSRSPWLILPYDPCSESCTPAPGPSWTSPTGQCTSWRCRTQEASGAVARPRAVARSVAAQAGHAPGRGLGVLALHGGGVRERWRTARNTACAARCSSRRWARRRSRRTRPSTVTAQWWSSSAAKRRWSSAD